MKRCPTGQLAVHGVQRADAVVTWMLDDRLPARLQIQAHKFIWTPETRGV